MMFLLFDPHFFNKSILYKSYNYIHRLFLTFGKPLRKLRTLPTGKHQIKESYARVITSWEINYYKTWSSMLTVSYWTHCIKYIMWSRLDKYGKLDCPYWIKSYIAWLYLLIHYGVFIMNRWVFIHLFLFLGIWFLI